jgi:release factor glutamine methyltransferase
MRAYLTNMTDLPLTLVKAWTLARKRLEAAGIETPVIDARIMLLAATGLPRVTLISEPHTPMLPEAEALFESYVSRRVGREPAAHIVGTKGFWTLDLKSDRRGLVPRPETEVIVDLVLKAHSVDTPKSVLDLGIGSGTILLALLAERKTWTGIGVDVSPDALELAAENAEVHQLSDRMTLRQGDWHHGILEKFDIVVSNPPYIPSSVIETLQDEVRLHDPRLALDGGKDGLDPYTILFEALPNLLQSGGMFAFEFGIEQGPSILSMAKADMRFENVRLIKDLSNIDRVIVGTLV